MILLRAVLFVAAILLCCPASAHWQYTKWGMTEAEAEAASDGKMTRPVGDRIAADDWYIGLVGKHEAVGKVYDVKMSFNVKERTLVSVSLTSYNEGDCISLLQGLQARAAQEVINAQKGSEKYLWRDSARGNLVQFSNMEAAGALVNGEVNGTKLPLCYVQYDPLVDPNDGL